MKKKALREVRARVGIGCGHGRSKLEQQGVAGNGGDGPWCCTAGRAGSKCGRSACVQVIRLRAWRESRYSDLGEGLAWLLVVGRSGAGPKHGDRQRSWCTAGQQLVVACA